MSKDNKEEEEKAKVWLMGQRLSKLKFNQEAYENARKEREREEHEEHELEEEEEREAEERKVD